MLKLARNRANRFFKNRSEGEKVANLTKPITKAVKRKLKYDLKDYCEMRGLSLSSLYKGYVSQKARKILEKDGIKVA